MESVIAYSPDLAIVLYWVMVTIVVGGCIGFASAWTKYEENHR